jgi:hypothetical protein
MRFTSVERNNGKVQRFDMSHLEEITVKFNVFVMSHLKEITVKFSVLTIAI